MFRPSENELLATPIKVEVDPRDTTAFYEASEEALTEHTISEKEEDLNLPINNNNSKLLDSTCDGDPASLIRKDDILEYLIEEEEGNIWFVVQVMSRGKPRGKNRNYINVRYADGSVGGVYIDMHQWRILKRSDGCKRVKARTIISNNS